MKNSYIKSIFVLLFFIFNSPIFSQTTMEGDNQWRLDDEHEWHWEAGPFGPPIGWVPDGSGGYVDPGAGGDDNGGGDDGTAGGDGGDDGLDQDDGDDDGGDNGGGWGDDDGGFAGNGDDFFDDFWDDPIHGGGPHPGNGNPPTKCHYFTYLTTEFAWALTATGVIEQTLERTTIGIGEEFTVYIKNLCAGDVKWEIINSSSENGSTSTEPAEGEIVKQSTYNIKVKAGFKLGTITIKANFLDLRGECEKCPAELEIKFIVIEPSGVFYEYNFSECTKPVHLYKKPSMLYMVDYYLQPDNVNFYNVKIKEDDLPANCTGAYFSNFPTEAPCPISHGPASSYKPLTTMVIQNKGTKNIERDMIGQNFVCDNKVSASNSGIVTFEIGWYYLRTTPSGGLPVKFTTLNQKAENVGGVNSKFILSKGNISKENYLDDVNSCTSDTCN
jgi:hypothetical protein